MKPLQSFKKEKKKKKQAATQKLILSLTNLTQNMKYRLMRGTLCLVEALLQ